jgi:hypothetical protein
MDVDIGFTILAICALADLYFFQVVVSLHQDTLWVTTFTDEIA